MNKLAFHAHERGKERLNFSPKSVDAIQKAVDKMWFGGGYKKLPDNHYHIHIKDPYHNLLGYAALKRVNASGRRPRLILASILSKDMKPNGTNISNFIHTHIKENRTNIHIPKHFKGMPPIPNNHSNN